MIVFIGFWTVIARVANNYIIICEKNPPTTKTPIKSLHITNG